MADLDSAPTAFPAERAQTLLAPYLEVLAACIRESWGRWLTFLNADGIMASPLSARTRAGIVSDHMWHLVKTRFAGMTGARTSEERGLRILSLNDQVNIRFKKLDERFRSRNIRTAQQIALARQLTFPWLPASPNITMGYVLDPLQTTIETIAVTYPLDNKNIWSFVVEEAATEILVAPASVAPAEMTRVRRVRVKGVDQNTAQRKANE